MGSVVHLKKTGVIFGHSSQVCSSRSRMGGGRLCERRKGRKRGSPEGSCTGAATMPQSTTLRLICHVTDDDDVFYLFLQKQKRGAELHIYLEEGTYHKRLFRETNTNDMKK